MDHTACGAQQKYDLLLLYLNLICCLLYYMFCMYCVEKLFIVLGFTCVYIGLAKLIFVLGFAVQCLPFILTSSYWSCVHMIAKCLHLNI